MNFAVIETGGKQYVVKPGETLIIEKLPKTKKGEKVTFSKVLLLDDGKNTRIGTPYIAGETVEAEITGEGKGKKITILKYKNKTRYRVKKGHRQPFTKVTIAGGTKRKETQKESKEEKSQTPKIKKTTAKK